MATLTLSIPYEAYDRLRSASARSGKAPTALAEEWLLDRLDSLPEEDEEPGTVALRQAGLLFSDPLALHRTTPKLSLQEIQEALGNHAGTTLGDIVLEQRRSREW